MTAMEISARPSLGEATATFARIGLLSFGGPAGQIALMHRILVDEKRWLDEERFLHALNYCMLLPGPEAMQLATYAGWLLHGVRGGLIAGLLFGLKAAVLAVVVEALMRVSKRALKGPAHVAIAVAAFVAIAFFGVLFPIIVLAAAALGAALHFVSGTDRRQDQRAAGIAAGADMPEWTRPSFARFATSLSVWLALWLGPLVLLHLLLGSGNVFAREASFFSIMAAVTFGGAYAVLAWVAQQAVEVHGWLMPDEMLTGLGLAETTPGPLILVLVFVGFLGAARLSGLEPLAGGLAGAVVTLWFTFVPCFLWIFVGAPYVETVRSIGWLASALAAVTAAVVGIIANLAVWFGLHVLFAEVGEWRAGPLRVPVPDLASFDALAALIAVAAGIALLRFHANMIAVLVGAAVAGMAARLAFG